MATFTAFTAAGSRDGADLVQHDCARFGVAYVSELSHPEDAHLVPGCGCRPDPATSEAGIRRWVEVPSVRVSTAQKILDAGFTLPGFPEGGLCPCGHDFGPHEFAAVFGSPLDGGLYRCQEAPACECAGTWNTSWAQAGS